MAATRAGTNPIVGDYGSPAEAVDAAVKRSADIGQRKNDIERARTGKYLTQPTPSEMAFGALNKTVTPDEQPTAPAIESFTLTNERGAIAQVITYGATVADLRMPDQSGLRLLQILNERDAHERTIPIIITSGHADMDDVIGLFRNGAADFLPKPIHYEHLVEQLKRFFPEHQMG